VFGEAGEARICPSYRVALLRPLGGLTTFDLTVPGSAMAIGALPSLADGAYPRSLTQEWARAIYEDNPTGSHVDGVRYTSAYNGGRSLALWDIAARVAVVHNSSSTPQDFPLADPAVLPRLQVALRDRRVHLTLVPASSCADCP